MRVSSDRFAESESTTLLIVGISQLLADLLRRAFEEVPDIQVIGALESLNERPDRSEYSTVDVILLGFASVRVAEKAAATRAARDQYGTSKLIAISENPDCSETIALFHAGASGIFRGPAMRFDLLCKSIRCVHAGQVWADNELVHHLILALTSPRSTVVTDSFGRKLLTKREQQVLHLLADGMSNPELAAELKLSEHTVKNHLFRIYDKLGVSNRMEAVLYALAPRIETVK